MKHKGKGRQGGAREERWRGGIRREGDRKKQGKKGRWFYLLLRHFRMVQIQALGSCSEIQIQVLLNICHKSLPLCKRLN